MRVDDPGAWLYQDHPEALEQLRAVLRESPLQPGRASMVILPAPNSATIHFDERGHLVAIEA